MAPLFYEAPALTFLFVFSLSLSSFLGTSLVCVGARGPFRKVIRSAALRLFAITITSIMIELINELLKVSFL